MPLRMLTVLPAFALVIVEACSTDPTLPNTQPPAGGSGAPVGMPDLDGAISDTSHSDSALGLGDGAPRLDATSSPEVGVSGVEAGAALSFTPWLLLDAEKGTIGQTYQGSASDQWSSAAGKTTVDSTHVFEGKNAFKMHADKGTPNNGGLFGSWGGIKTLPTKLEKGDVLHVQLALYMPSTFDWMANPWLKFLRFHTVSAAGANQGYDDVYIYNDGTLNNIYEGAKTNFWAMTSVTLSKEGWEIIEYEVTFDDVSVDDGGHGRTRLWRADGGKMVLALDRTNSNTLVTPTDEVDGFFLFTYWNSGQDDGKFPAQAQDVWVDRVVLEKDLSKLTELDAQGNRVIGGL